MELRNVLAEPGRRHCGVKIVNPRIASIENYVAYDPGGRNVFDLMLSDQLRLAAASLLRARRVGIVTGLYVPGASASETDGPPGAKLLGDVLGKLDVEIDFLTDAPNEPALRALGLNAIVDLSGYLDTARPSHLISVERLGRCRDGRYRTMRGEDVTQRTAPLDELFLEAGAAGITTIGIGDGGNEIGMGKVFASVLAGIPHGGEIACVVATDFCIAAGTSNWGAYGLGGALSVLAGDDLLPPAEEAARDVERLVTEAGAVDGRTRRSEPTVDGLALSVSLRVLENIRRQTVSSPFADSAESVRVGVLGYGETGRAATALLMERGHRVRVSDRAGVTIEPGIELDGLQTGGHTCAFLEDCDTVVTSPGVLTDAPIRGELYRLGIPVVSELEMAHQLCDREVIGVTGTVGKRSTVELLERMFGAGRRDLAIGGNKGRPLSALLRTTETGPIALAVSSFQLEAVTYFNPGVAAILNIHEEHLERHGSMAEYIRIKSRIFMNHASTDSKTDARPDGPRNVLILHYDDPRLRALARKHMGRTLFISSCSPIDRGAWLEGSTLMVNLDGEVERLDVSRAHPEDVRFPENLLTAVVVSRLFGIASNDLQRFLCGQVRE